MLICCCFFYIPIQVFPISGIWISLNAFIVILNLFSISSQTYETNKIKIVATMMILIQTSRNEFTHNMLVSFLLKENLPLNRLLQCHRDIFDSQMEDADIIKRKFEVLTSKHLNLKLLQRRKNVWRRWIHSIQVILLYLDACIIHVSLPCTDPINKPHADH